MSCRSSWGRSRKQVGRFFFLVWRGGGGRSFGLVGAGGGVVLLLRSSGSGSVGLDMFIA